MQTLNISSNLSHWSLFNNLDILLGERENEVMPNNVSQLY